MMSKREKRLISNDACNRQLGKILCHRPDMLSAGLWCAANDTSKNLLKGADLEEEQSPKKMSHIGSILEAKILIIEPVQNAAGNKWRDAKMALEESKMMMDLWVDVFVGNLRGKSKCKPLGTRHGVATAGACFVGAAFGLQLFRKK